MQYIIVAIGGVAGSIARFAVGKYIAERKALSFPLSTFLINIIGAFLLGFANGMDINSKLSLLFADGFLGAFTTFSTFMYEGFFLFQEDEKMPAFRYIFTTLFLGIIGFIIGLEIGKFIHNL